jgi:hypothetical protein
MKIQDIGFIVAVVVLFMIRKPKLFVYAGLGSLVLAIPLFAKWVFFTAERLTWYSAGFFLCFIITTLIHSRNWGTLIPGMLNK